MGLWQEGPAHTRGILIVQVYVQETKSTFIIHITGADEAEPTKFLEVTEIK